MQCRGVDGSRPLFLDLAAQCGVDPEILENVPARLVIGAGFVAGELARCGVIDRDTGGDLRLDGLRPLEHACAVRQRGVRVQMNDGGIAFQLGLANDRRVDFRCLFVERGGLRHLRRGHGLQCGGNGGRAVLLFALGQLDDVGGSGCAFRRLFLGKTDRALDARGAFLQLADIGLDLAFLFADQLGGNLFLRFDVSLWIDLGEFRADGDIEIPSGFAVKDIHLAHVERIEAAEHIGADHDGTGKIEETVILNATLQDERSALCGLLKIETGAPAEAITAAVTKLQTETETALASVKSSTSAAEVKALKSDLDQTRTALTALQKKDADREIDAALDAEIAAGKITPASRDGYRAMCAENGGLERFKALAATLPVICAPSDLDNRNVNTRTAEDDRDPVVIASLARKYQDDQAALGISVSISEAVRHVEETKTK